MGRIWRLLTYSVNRIELLYQQVEEACVHDWMQAHCETWNRMQIHSINHITITTFDKEYKKLQGTPNMRREDEDSRSVQLGIDKIDKHFISWNDFRFAYQFDSGDIKNFFFSGLFSIWHPFCGRSINFGFICFWLYCIFEQENVYEKGIFNGERINVCKKREYERNIPQVSLITIYKNTQIQT